MIRYFRIVSLNIKLAEICDCSTSWRIKYCDRRWVLDTHAEMRTAKRPALRYACGFCSLREWCWRPGLEEGELQRLHAIVRHSPLLPDGHHIFRTDDPFTAIYAVNRGCIKSYTTDIQGKEHVRGFHLPGELFGFDAAYPEHHKFNALVVKAASVCIIPYQDIASLSRRITGLYGLIFARLSRDYSRQQLCIEGSNATQQTAIFLFDLESRLQWTNGGDREFDLPMSHESIANYLRFTPETMSRVLRKLEEAGAIRVDHNHIRFLDVACLGLIAQGVQEG